MAEEIWYSIVWEKEKTTDNVIDYNIREEITKDTSAIENANNQTTTWMATQIPWVNEPKLIAKTSIIGGAAWWGGSMLISTASYKRTSDPWTSYEEYDLQSLSSPWWDLYVENNRIHWDSWTYLIIFNSYVSNVNVTSTEFDLRYYNDGWLIRYVERWIWWKAISGATVFTFEPWYFLRLFWQLNYGTTNVTLTLNFIKIA